MWARAINEGHGRWVGQVGRRGAGLGMAPLGRRMRRGRGGGALCLRPHCEEPCSTI
jgi:hypothetical protein